MPIAQPPKPCCPPFNPDPWEDQTLNWNNKLFIKSSIFTFFHIPLPPMVNGVIAKLWKAAQTGGAAPEMKDFLMLTYDPTAWKSEYYMAVTKEVQGIENVKLSGTYLTKVYDGPYSDVPKWMADMDAYVGKQGKKAEKYYFYYTTCPGCAKIYGHNYVVLFAQLSKQ